VREPFGGTDAGGTAAFVVLVVSLTTAAPGGTVRTANGAAFGVAAALVGRPDGFEAGLPSLAAGRHISHAQSASFEFWRALYPRRVRPEHRM